MAVIDTVASIAGSGPATGSRSDLIRTCGSIELPATGCWAIPGGQRLEAGGHWPRRRRRRRAAFTGGGRLDVPFDPFAMRLELVLILGGHRRLPAVRCVATLFEADSLGRWTFTGTASAGGHPPDSVVIRAWYQGVYDQGARPVALLRIDATLPRPANTPPGRRLRTRVDLFGEINACRLYTYPEPGRRQVNVAAYSGERWNISN